MDLVKQLVRHIWVKKRYLVAYHKKIKAQQKDVNQTAGLVNTKLLKSRWKTRKSHNP